MRTLSGTLSALLLTALLGFATPSAHAAGAPAAVPAATERVAAAPGRKQCMPRPARQSLVVKGAISCKKAKKITLRARELALATKDHGYQRFTISGLLCQLRKNDPKRFTCRDIDGTPKRFLKWTDRT